MSIRVLLCDDQALVRRGFRFILEDEDDLEVVGEADDGAQAVELNRQLAPDVVLMDVRMPGLDGIEATRRICAERGNRSRIIILTTFDLDEYVLDGLRAGASGFLLKDTRPEPFLEAIRAVASGEAMLAPTATRRLLERFASQRVPPPGGVPLELESLTERELDVIKLLATGGANADIAAQLFLSEATVKAHVSSILRKLRLRDRTQAVVLAYESGLVLPGAADERR